MTLIQAVQFVSENPNPKNWPQEVLGNIKLNITIFGQIITFPIGTRIIEILCGENYLKSKSAARKALTAGAIKVNGEKCQQENFVVENMAHLGCAVIENGKRNFSIVKII